MAFSEPSAPGLAAIAAACRRLTHENVSAVELFDLGTHQLKAAAVVSYMQLIAIHPECLYDSRAIGNGNRFRNVTPARRPKIYCFYHYVCKR